MSPKNPTQADFWSFIIYNYFFFWFPKESFFISVHFPPSDGTSCGKPLRVLL